MTDQTRALPQRTKLSTYLQEILERERMPQVKLLNMMKRLGLRKDKRAVLSNIVRGVSRVPRREILEPLARALSEVERKHVTMEDLREMASQLDTGAEVPSGQGRSLGAQAGPGVSPQAPGTGPTGRPAGTASKEGSSPRYKLAIGHCLWAAPIALAIRGKNTDEFKVICCDWKKFFAEDAYLERSGEWPDKQPGPETPGADSPSEAQVEGEADATTENKGPVGSLSAAQVLDLLLDRRLVDAAAVPLDVAEEEATRLRLVGTLVDCEVGCTLVYPVGGKLDDALKGAATSSKALTSGKKQPSSSPKEDGEEEEVSTEEVTTKELGLALSKLAKPLAQIGAEDETVANVFLEDAIKRGWPTTEPHNPAPYPSDVQWPYNNRDLAWTSFQELQTKCRESGDRELAGIITWEPHGTWAVRQSKKDVTLRKVSLVYARGHRGSKRHLRFGVVIRTEDAFKKDFCDALTLLMRNVEPCAQRLNKIINDGSGSVGDLSYIAWFYGLTTSRKPPKNLSLDLRKEVREVLASCHYSVRNLVSSSRIDFDA